MIFLRETKSVENLNKLVSHDMKHLNNWLSTFKISLNIEKTELIILNLQEKYFLIFKIKLIEKGYIHQTRQKIFV